MKKVIVLIFSILSFILLNNNQTFACSCMMPPSPNESKESATSVFIWTVSDVSEKKSDNWYDEYEINFSWIKSIKWEWTDVKKVYTAQSSATCWYNFEEWKEYIVYTNWDNEEQSVSLCSRTSLTQYAKEDLEEFKTLIQENNSQEETENYTNEDNGLIENENITENNNEVPNENISENENDNKNKIYITYLLIIFIFISMWIILFRSKK